jgi:hypothetical protein
MAQNGINYYYTGVLGLNQDSLKVFYDFESGDSNYILSVPIGNAEHSGQILGNSGDFFGDMSSGNFYNNGIKIANSTGIFSKNATFIVTQEKTGINGGTIFSNFEGGNFKSGYHFGINDANKFYWGYQDDQDPVIETALTTLSDKNAFAVKLEENNVSFCYYNNNTLQFEKSSWGINSDTLLPSDQWFIGTGKNLKPYDHSIDNFIYVNRALPDASLIRLFSGLWNESSGNFSGYLPYETGQITGYTTTITGITGILNTTQEFSGNFTGQSQIEVYQFIPQTGVILPGGTELEFLQNMPQFCTNREEQPIYWEKNVTVESTGITGVEKVFSGFSTIDQVTPVYNEVIETGFISSGEVLQPIYNTGNANDIIFSGSISNIPDIPYLNSFGMKSVSYLGQNGDGVFESLSSTGTPLQNYYNKLATYNFSNLTFQTDATYNSGYVDVFLNGLIQSTGGYAITGEFFNAGVEISGDYFISGKNIYFKDAVSNSDILLYDIRNSGDKLYFDETDYSISGTLPVDVNGKLFFNTGVKLISGLDYTGNNGLFYSIRGTQIQSTFAFSDNFVSGSTGIDPSFEIISGVYDGDLNTPDLFTGASGQFILDTGIWPTGFYDTETGIVTFPAYTGWQLYSGTDVYDIRTGINPLPPTNGWANGTEFYVPPNITSGEIRTIEQRNFQNYLSNVSNSVVNDGVFVTYSGDLVTFGNFSGVASGQTFLRDTSINWINGVRLDKDFLEHGSVDLLNGNQISNGGLSGFFSNNTDFWQ